MIQASVCVCVCVCVEKGGGGKEGGHRVEHQEKGGYCMSEDILVFSSFHTFLLVLVLSP
jgi:hypothetical protein